MTREEAFKTIITQRGIHNKLNFSSGYIRSLRKKLKDGGHITQDKMLDILNRYGAKIIQEEKWEIPH